MKHRYSPLVIVLITLFCLLFSFAMFYLFPDFIREHSKGRYGLDSLIIALAVLIPLTSIRENANRTVETFSEYIKFNNSSLKAMGKLKKVFGDFKL